MTGVVGPGSRYWADSPTPVSDWILANWGEVAYYVIPFAILAIIAGWAVWYVRGNWKTSMFRTLYLRKK